MEEVKSIRFLIFYIREFTFYIRNYGESCPLLQCCHALKKFDLFCFAHGSKMGIFGKECRGVGRNYNEAQHSSPLIKSTCSSYFRASTAITYWTKEEGTCPEHFNLVSLFTLPKELLWTSANACGLPYIPVNPFAFIEQSDFLNTSLIYKIGTLVIIIVIFVCLVLVKPVTVDFWSP